MKCKIWRLKSFGIALKDEDDAVGGLSLHNCTGINALYRKFRDKKLCSWWRGSDKSMQKIKCVWLQVKTLPIDGKEQYGDGKEQKKRQQTAEHKLRIYVYYSTKKGKMQ